MNGFLPRTLAVLLLACALAGKAEARTVCTLVVDALSGATLLETGDCDTRVTPASTFKIALGLMGYDAGILEGANHPVLEIRRASRTGAGGHGPSRPVPPTG